MTDILSGLVVVVSLVGFTVFASLLVVDHKYGDYFEQQAVCSTPSVEAESE